MDWKSHIREALTLVLAAVVCAFVSNAASSRERKLATAGNYPNALVVPERSTSPTEPVISAIPVAEPATATALPSAPDPAVTSTVTTTAAPAATAPAIKTDAATTVPKAAPAAIPPAPQQATTAQLLARFPPHENKAYAEISGDDVAWLYQQGVLFFDARRTSVFEAGHIAGARSFPVWESDIDQRVAQLVEEGLDPNRPVVIYCSGGDCEDSHMLADRLFGVFFTNALVYKDGFPDWQKRGGPIRTGPS